MHINSDTPTRTRTPIPIPTPRYCGVLSTLLAVFIIRPLFTLSVVTYCQFSDSIQTSTPTYIATSPSICYIAIRISILYGYTIVDIVLFMLYILNAIVYYVI